MSNQNNSNKAYDRVLMEQGMMSMGSNDYLNYLLIEVVGHNALSGLFRTRFYPVSMSTEEEITQYLEETIIKFTIDFTLEY